MFIVDTQLITLTSANESACLYIKNTSPTLYLIPVYSRICFGSSTGGTTTDVIVRGYFNPTAGTILVSGTPSAGGNANSGFNTLAPCTVLIGAEGLTAVAIATLADIAQVKTVYDAPPGFNLAPGGAIIAAITPPPGNTSMKVDLELGFVMIDPTMLL